MPFIEFYAAQAVSFASRAGLLTTTNTNVISSFEFPVFKLKP
jgi:hypothetical protein